MRSRGAAAYKIIPQQLHDQRGVLVAFLTQGIQLGNGVIESLLGEMACLVRRVENFVVEDGEIQSKTKTNWMSRCKVGLRDFGGILVSLEGLVSGSLALVTKSEFGQVAVVVSLPDVETTSATRKKLGEDDELTSCGRRPLIRLSVQMRSSACPKPPKCLHRSWQAQPRLPDGIL